ncbi:MAG TPA: 16S rRNA (guanine(966)-N(2))-methyltransferase RsmD [Gammaproteobacteria bacterium]|nr:16S rRNA (guanine(966)-N(2))-methyltransferase RsmD [Gammaproteobacteria bacterium]
MAGHLRIVGGRWRGRRLTFPDAGGVRPTADRIRETLFNWLQPVVPGARCLDLFAGSGGLGLEALSRGAAEVVFVERDRRLADQLRANLETLGAEGARVVQQDARTYLKGPCRPFDLVFLDPPFRRGALDALCQELAAGGWLAPGARVYLEHEAEAGPPDLPAGWELLRSKKAGQVGYHLAAVP